MWYGGDPGAAMESTPKLSRQEYILSNKARQQSLCNSAKKTFSRVLDLGEWATTSELKTNIWTKKKTKKLKIKKKN